MDKQQLRRAATLRRNQLDERQRRSLAICERVCAMPIYQSATAVHCYLPIRSEVDTWPLIANAVAHSKQVAVPLVTPDAAEIGHGWLDSLDALETGAFGIRQPRNPRAVPPGAWSLVIVPLLAFDRRGYRLGYGKGHYDRMLASHASTTIGVAFAAQEVAQVPTEPHDVRLDWIVTEAEVIPKDEG